VEERPVSAIYILWLRELKRYARSRAMIIASIGQPLLYLFALGFGLGPVFQQAGRGSYLQFVAPGVIGMSVLFTSIFSGLGLLWDRQFGFLKETLVAPVPRLHIMIGKTVGGASVAILQGLLITIICLVAGFRPAHLSTLPLAFLFMSLEALVFAALGMVIGSKLQNMQGFQLIMNFIVLPIFFLSGALYPLTNLPAVLAAVTRLDPLTYAIDGLRGAFIDGGHFAPATNVAVLCGVAALFLALGARAFDKIQI
jgi:ABC-2 type transport system permease protein